MTKQNLKDIKKTEKLTTNRNQSSTTAPKIAQNQFLTLLCKKKLPGAIYLTSGICLKGILYDCDSSTITLKSPNNANLQLVYKHAIATVVPL